MILLDCLILPICKRYDINMVNHFIMRIKVFSIWKANGVYEASMVDEFVKLLPVGFDTEALNTEDDPLKYPL